MKNNKIEDYNIDAKIEEHIYKYAMIKGLTKEEVESGSDGYKELLLGAISNFTKELLKEHEVEALNRRI